MDSSLGISTPPNEFLTRCYFTRWRTRPILRPTPTSRPSAKSFKHVANLYQPVSKIQHKEFVKEIKDYQKNRILYGRTGFAVADLERSGAIVMEPSDVEKFELNDHREFLRAIRFIPRDICARFIVVEVEHFVDLLSGILDVLVRELHADLYAFKAFLARTSMNIAEFTSKMGTRDCPRT